MNAEQIKSKKINKFKVTPEMAKHPRIQLSLPGMNPFSQKYKQQINDMCKANPLADEESKVPPHNFYQANTIGNFLKIAYKRDSLDMLKLNDAVELSNLNCYGAKFLVAGTDATVFKFLQEYVNGLLDLKDVKSLNIRKYTQVFLVPNDHNTICSYIANRDPLYRQNIFQFFSNMNPLYRAQVKAGGVVPQATTNDEYERRDITDQAL